MSDLIYQVHNQTYTSQKGIGLYPTAGTARDWYKDKHCSYMLYKHLPLNSTGFIQMMLMLIMVNIGQLVILLNYETLADMDSCCHLIRFIRLYHNAENTSPTNDNNA